MTMEKMMEPSTLVPNPVFAGLASDEQIKRAAEALEANGITTLIAENGEEAEKLVFDQLPEGAEVFTPLSRTLEQLGLTADLVSSGRYDVVRTKLAKMDRKTQNREMIKLGAAPEYIVGSVQAVTEDGKVLVASGSGSQLGPYSAGAGKVIWVVGAQKIVRDLEEGMRRLYEYALPREDARMMALHGGHSSLNKILIVNKDRPGRVTMVIVKEELGF